MTPSRIRPYSPALPARGAALTIGVEEEFQLIRADTGTPSPGGEAVLDHAHRMDTRDSAGHLQREILASMVETATGICADLAQVRRELTSVRDRLATAADKEGLLPWAAGVHPASAPARQVTESKHYRSVHQLYGPLVTETETCGCHVHVGTLDRDEAITALNHLRPWLPTLLALSANSAFHNGVDTGYASWRTVALSRWPTTHIPPHLDSAAHFEDALASLHRAGVLPDGANAYWLVRPSIHLPTVEVRVADVSSTVDGAVLQAGLVRALVHAALDEPAHARDRTDGRDRTDEDQLLTAALWTAARHGISGPAVHPRTGHRIPANDLALELLEELRPALRTTGDLAEIEHLLHRVLREGCGADRQRASSTGGGR